ncbi:MAG: hypothetical protein MUE69_27595 [Myxococcota bacterium]|nr:hypothetical protein [Myxococcota bacterium]
MRDDLVSRPLPGVELDRVPRRQLEHRDDPRAHQNLVRGGPQQNAVASGDLVVGRELVESPNEKQDTRAGIRREREGESEEHVTVEALGVLGQVLSDRRRSWIAAGPEVGEE